MCQRGLRKGKGAISNIKAKYGGEGWGIASSSALYSSPVEACDEQGGHF